MTMNISLKYAQEKRMYFVIDMDKTPGLMELMKAKSTSDIFATAVGWYHQMRAAPGCCPPPAISCAEYGEEHLPALIRAGLITLEMAPKRLRRANEGDTWTTDNVAERMLALWGSIPLGEKEAYLDALFTGSAAPPPPENIAYPLPPIEHPHDQEWPEDVADPAAAIERRRLFFLRQPPNAAAGSRELR
ncbi:hypothetical protein GJ689_24555 [Rhodoplanes serenus]|uniref:Uncharacterized protein n=1 Tax=Rhodoplanes serenus TaxID=200615 RepID=A0A9X5AU74_9BRAD|nr:hypothetical protein [Rhodoplanes serenus]MTW19367.1 hypothetical protein [Rhodoplanes serenus]